MSSMSDEPAIPQAALHKFLGNQGSAFDFSRYFLLFRRNLWLILVIVCVVMAATYAWLSRQPKLYASRAVVEVEQEEAKVLGSRVEDVQRQNLESDDYIQTIVQSLTSTSVMLRAAQILGLDKDPTLFPGVTAGKTYTEDAIAGQIRRRVGVSLRRNTRLIDITTEDVNPQRASNIAGAVEQAYLRQTFEEQFRTANQATQFLQEEADKLKKKLEESERRLQQYKEEHNAVSLETSENIITERLKDLNTRAIDAKNTRIKLESDLEMVRKIPANDTNRMLQIGSVGAIQQVSEIRAQIVNAEADLAALQKRYLPLHPKYIGAVTQIQRLKESLVETLRNAGKILETQYSSAKDSEDKLNAMLQEQENAALDLSKLAIPYNTLQREVDSDKAMYDALNTRIRETSISKGIEKSPFHLVEEPVPGNHPVKPEMTKVLGLAFVVSLALAIAMIVTIDSLDESLRSVDQAEEFLGLPALAVVPEEQSKQAGSAFVRNDSRQAEAFRSLRTGLSMLGNDEEARRIFLMTSAVPSEGKSFSSLSLAHAFAMDGHRTLLVEADMRRPSLYKAFPKLAKRDTLGLTDVLSGNSVLDEVFVPAPEENLTLLFAGRAAPSPAELLSGRAFDKIIARLLNIFDRIVIDTAPINAVSETLTMISAAQYVVLVVRPAHTSKRAVARACHLIGKAKGVMAGFVLNRANFKIGSGYYYYYYGKKYSYKGYYQSK
jgi:succinoglycan biosynthesis transport protein ExoP